MIKAIPMEDWLRGCVYHDGRHGTVTLPTDKVLQIANYIQRTRRSISDGLIDLAVEPVSEQTEPSEMEWKWFTKDFYKGSKLIGSIILDAKEVPRQTERKE